MTNKERGSENKRLNGIHSIVFVDIQTKKRVVFSGSNEIFEMIADLNNASVVTNNDLGKFPEDVINNIPDENWIIRNIDTFGYNPDNRHTEVKVVFLDWKYLPQEFDPTCKTNS